MNILTFLKERWYLIAALILMTLVIVGASIFLINFLKTSDTPIFEFRQLTTHDASKKSVYLVGISGTDVPPFLIHDRDMPTGLDISLIQWISNDAEINIAFVPVSSLREGFDALRNEEIDMLLSGLSITPGRMEEFLFSDPYLSTAQQIAVREASSLTLINFYIGPGIIGASAGTTSYEMTHDLLINQNFESTSRVREIRGVKQVAEDLVNRKIDFMVADERYMEVFAQEYPLKVIGTIFTGEEYGIAFRKDDVALQSMMSASLKKLLNSPEWSTIKYRYYPDQLQ